MRRLGNIVVLAAVALVPAAARADGPARKPNFVVLFGDDFGWGDISANGCKDMRTPHLDSLARDGVRCTSGYVTAPVCSPSRGGLLTGMYPQRWGQHGNGGPYAPPGADTFAEALGRLGYAAGTVGKWHQGGEADPKDPRHPRNQGFKDWYGRGGLQAKAPADDGRGPVGKEVAAAIDFVERHRDGPFVFYLPLGGTHTRPSPNIPPSLKDEVAGIADPGRRSYCASVLEIDRAVGRLLARLAALKLDEHTVVFFLTDNGGAAYNAASNGPLRGGKLSAFEGGVRVPFLVRWKGTIPAGRTFDHPVSALDLLPTMVAAAGGTVPKDQPADGVDLLPHFLGKDDRPPHEFLFWDASVRRGDWKLIVRGAGGGLYDLSKDAGETTDVAAKNPAVVAELRAAHGRWLKDVPNSVKQP